MIRLATPEDQPSMLSLINQAFVVETFLEGERTSAPEIQAMLDTGEFLLAIANDVIVASVYTEVRGESGYFGMLSVTASQQGIGLGRMMMIHAAEQHCRSKGCKRIGAYGSVAALRIAAALP